MYFTIIYGIFNWQRYQERWQAFGEHVLRPLHAKFERVHHDATTWLPEVLELFRQELRDPKLLTPYDRSVIIDSHVWGPAVTRSLALSTALHYSIETASRYYRPGAPSRAALISIPGSVMILCYNVCNDWYTQSLERFLCPNFEAKRIECDSPLALKVRAKVIEHCQCTQVPFMTPTDAHPSPRSDAAEPLDVSDKSMSVPGTSSRTVVSRWFSDPAERGSVDRSLSHCAAGSGGQGEGKRQMTVGGLDLVHLDASCAKVLEYEHRRLSRLYKEIEQKRDR
ncbi:unnamed protein product [Vitrella brassicaformis CCMP3155]|uniref:Uncharacterized protein n=1 Tax=Vitrella brassicaformis (strain CCMP3155) TaxID=1169540 RepID=A0A0G4FXC4_VITBC|nr:unnamed protein product [Vitrella brassicaformis CCMP3155]|eukprot:CEM19646.1 unnamed protein product [Vitrella brassicaformis CCMP3155]